MRFSRHTTWQGQAMTDAHLGQATRGMQTSHQWPASSMIPTATPETSVSDSQIHNPVSHYHDTSGQSFALTNQTAIPQYLPAAPVVAPVAHRQNVRRFSSSRSEAGTDMIVYSQTPRRSLINSLTGTHTIVTMAGASSRLLMHPLRPPRR